MAVIYLLRHGETLWNREGRIQGHRDSALSPRGAAQARAMGATLAELLGDRPGCVLVTSPLGRTQQTATIVGRCLGLDGAPIEFDDRLKELSWGDWDGMTRAEIEARWPGALAARYADPLAHWHHKPPNGESFAGALERAADWLVAASKRGSAVVAIAHGGIGRVLRGVHARLGPTETLRQDEPQDAFFRLHRHGIDRIETTA